MDITESTPRKLNPGEVVTVATEIDVFKGNYNADGSVNFVASARPGTLDITPQKAREVAGVINMLANVAEGDQNDQPSPQE